MKSIGIDIGKRRCIVCTMDRNGTVPGGDGIREHLRRGRRVCKEGKEGVREMPSGVRVDGKSLDQDVRGV